jgi:hypothetical protein
LEYIFEDMKEPMLIRDPDPATPAPGPGSAAATPPPGKSTAARRAPRGDRSQLMQQHVAARARRDAAALGSDEFRDAAEEVARIEVAIAKLEEPPFSG